MFYRPHFCCHCGEQVIRAKWTPITSRRFCDFCAIEQKQHDLIPRAAAVLLLLFGTAGFTAYLSGGKSGTTPDVAKASRIRELRSDLSRVDQSSANLGRTNVSRTSESNLEQPQANISVAENKQPTAPRNSSTEPVYFCGAMTKKGTACTRRVKAPGRCWQHLGQPAMSPLRK